MSSTKNLSRRHLLSIAGGAAGLLATSRAGAAERPVESAAAPHPNKVEKPVVSNKTNANEPPKGPVMRTHQLPKASEAALSVLGGLGLGSKVGEWTIGEVYDFHLGAVPVVLQAADGTRFQVDVLRRDDAVKGVTQTRHLSFFLANRGNGATPSNEAHGLGAMALAAAIARTESGTPAGLLSLAERAARFPGAGYAVPV